MLTPPFLMRVGISITSAFGALSNPLRQDLVAALGETTGLGALEDIRRQMLLNKTGRRILRERPLIHSTTTDLDKLANLPSDSFGYAYVQFLEENHITPDTRLDVQYIGDQELAYVMTRYRQIHDLWHVLAQMPITVEAEIGLKYFEYFQTKLPMTALSALFGPLNLKPTQRKLLFDTYIPWAISCASKTNNLMNVMYEDLWEQPIELVQRDLGFIPVSVYSKFNEEISKDNDNNKI